MTDSPFPILLPDVQLNFACQLAEIRRKSLLEGLQTVVGQLRVPEIDKQLAEFGSDQGLSKLAATGLRGELVYPLPLILRRGPQLLSYYRLLFGVSQKEFFGRGGFGAFKRMEEFGELTPACDAKLDRLCHSLCRTADALIDGLDALSITLVGDLQLLTLGAQLRGSRNTQIGDQASREVL